MYLLPIQDFILSHDTLLIFNLIHQSLDHIQNHNINSNIYFIFKHVPKFSLQIKDSIHTIYQINIKKLIDYPTLYEFITYPINK
jgi:hypothetical protein